MGLVSLQFLKRCLLNTLHITLPAEIITMIKPTKDGQPPLDLYVINLDLSSDNDVSFVMSNYDNRKRKGTDELRYQLSKMENLKFFNLFNCFTWFDVIKFDDHKGMA